MKLVFVGMKQASLPNDPPRPFCTIHPAIFELLFLNLDGDVVAAGGAF